MSELIWRQEKLPHLRLDREIRSGGKAMLAPGVPDTLASDGSSVGWLFRGALWLLDDAHVHVVSTPTPATQLLAGRDGWGLVDDTGYWRVNPRTGEAHVLETDWLGDDAQLRPGLSWVVLANTEEHRLLAAPGASNPTGLPIGALRSAGLAPWANGEGALWTDENTVYRASAQTRPTPVGELRYPVEVLIPGPDGAAVVGSMDGWLALAPRGRLVLLDIDLDPESIRFSADGHQALAATPNGLTTITLATGTSNVLFAQNAWPAGFLADDPVYVDESRGLLQSTKGAILQSGFALAGPAIRGDTLYGPGATAWSLRTGKPTWEGAPLLGGPTVVDSQREQIVSVGLEEGALMNADGSELARWPLPGRHAAAETEMLATLREATTTEVCAVIEDGWWRDDGNVELIDANDVLYVVDSESGEALETNAHLGDEDLPTSYDEEAPITDPFLENCTVVEHTSSGQAWGASGPDEAPHLVVPPNRQDPWGAKWPVPADAIDLRDGVVLAWTEEGSLLRLSLGSG